MTYELLTSEQSKSFVFKTTERALPNAIVTTYTYKPLVGILTMTDPRGAVTKYDYDAFGRLIRVTQAEKAIGWYDYHYKN